MNYCKRHGHSTNEVQCLCCEHCLPPGERTDGRMCPDELTQEEVVNAIMANANELIMELKEYDYRCIVAELRNDPNRFDGFMALIEEDIKSGKIQSNF